MGPQGAICRFTSGFTFALCDYLRFLWIIIFAFPLDFRISCFRLRFIRFGLLDSYVFDFDFYIFDFEFEIFAFEFEIFDFDCKNSRLRLKYYCSYFCPQRNAILQIEKTILEAVEFEKNQACVGKVKNRSKSYPIRISIMQCFVFMEKRNSKVVQN